MKSLALLKVQRTLETAQWEESTMSAKVVFATGEKTKLKFQETNSNCQAFCNQNAKHPDLEKRLCDYVDNKRQYRCTVTSEMYQLKALAITKELGITGFKATLRLCQVAGADLSSNGYRRGVATANHA